MPGTADRDGAAKGAIADGTAPPFLPWPVGNVLLETMTPFWWWPPLLLR